MHGHRLVFAGVREVWGDRRVLMLGPDGKQVSLPVAWTDMAEPDVFVAMSAGRSWFRVADLLELAAMLEQMRPTGTGM